MGATTIYAGKGELDLWPDYFPAAPTRKGVVLGCLEPPAGSSVTAIATRESLASA
jgi:hypothetical protein